MRNGPRTWTSEPQVTNLTGLPGADPGGLDALRRSTSRPRTAGTYKFFYFPQLTVNGIILGSVYALVALGYSMVYGILEAADFTHGDVYMIGAFMAWFALYAVGGAFNPSSRERLHRCLSCFAPRCSARDARVAIERFAYRPLRNAPGSRP